MHLFPSKTFCDLFLIWCGVEDSDGSTYIRWHVGLLLIAAHKFVLSGQPTTTDEYCLT